MDITCINGLEEMPYIIAQCAICPKINFSGKMFERIDKYKQKH